MKAEGTDDEEADGKSSRTDHFIFQGEKDDPAISDTESRQNGRQKNFASFHFVVLK